MKALAIGLVVLFESFAIAQICQTKLITVPKQKASTAHATRRFEHAKSRVLAAGFINIAGKAHVVTSTEHGTDGKDLTLYSLSSNKPLVVADSHLEDGSASWSADEITVAPDQSYFVVQGGGQTPVVFSPDLKKYKKLKAQRKKGTYIQEIRILSDSDTLLAFTNDSEVEIWERNSNGNFVWSDSTLVTYRSKSKGAEVKAVALSPNEERLAISFTNGDIAQYNVEDILLAKKHTQAAAISTSNGVRYCSRLAYSPDSKKLVAGFQADEKDETYLYVYHASGFQIANYFRQEPGKFSFLSFATNDRVVSVTRSPFSTATIWNVTARDAVKIAGAQFQRDNNARFINDTNGPLDPYHSVAVSPDGKWLALGTNAGNFSVWNTLTGKMLSTIRVGSDLRTLVFSRDSKSIITGSHMGDSRLFKIADL